MFFSVSPTHVVVITTDDSTRFQLIDNVLCDAGFHTFSKYSVAIFFITLKMPTAFRLYMTSRSDTVLVIERTHFFKYRRQGLSLCYY
jgi:hypothetical protein